MNALLFCNICISATVLLAMTGCGDQASQDPGKETPGNTQQQDKKNASANFVAGKDYNVFTRARILDKAGFSVPVEAFSLLIPKDWKHEGEVTWVPAGSACAGNNRNFKAVSPDGKYSFELLPHAIWSFNTDPVAGQFAQNNATRDCGYGQPLDAENYLKQVFVPGELGNPEIVEVKPNQPGAEELSKSTEKMRAEMMSYGASQVMFYPSAVNATVKWNDGSEGMVICGVNTSETTIPNIYNGTASKAYTSIASIKVVFKYPASERERVAALFSVILGSIRTNDTWQKEVDAYWLAIRQKKHVDHIGRIRLMDEQTRRMGEEIIRRGNQRLSDMDNSMRNWEARQQSQDRMHTSFIKTIREVETYRDETGKIELSGGYNHAWSRSDGSSFILTDNPNFDPSSVFQDQRWMEMKKVD